MPEGTFLNYTQGTQRTLSFQAFKPTGSVLNMASGQISVPVLKIGKYAGGSVVASIALSGTGVNGIMLQSAASYGASGKFFASVPATFLSGATTGEYDMVLVVSAGSAAGAVQESRVGFLVLSDQGR